MALPRLAGIEIVRILQIVKQRQLRGAEVFAAELSAELERRGHPTAIVYLYAHTGEGPALREQDTTLEGRDRHPFEKAPGFHPRLLLRLSDTVRSFRPDIVQVNGSRTVKYGSLLRRRWPRAPWALVYRSIGTSTDWLAGRFRPALYARLVLSRIDGIAAVTGESARRFSDGLASGRPCIEIPRGVNLGALVATETRRGVRERLGTPEGRGVILYAGSLSREKRVDRLLRVAEALHGQGGDVEVWIAGDGPLRGELETRAAAGAARVRFLGTHRDVASLMGAADVLLLTSDTEGTPGVVLEAGALALPVVATAVGGLRDCVHDGETGLLVPPGDEERLIEATASLLSDGEARHRLGGNARSWIADRFAIEAIAERYLELYEVVLERRAESLHRAGAS